MDIPVIAGTISTVIFAASNLPMLRKALRTRDVSSYSFASLALINAANIVYSLYVVTLPFGPIWVLHAFYVVSSAIMLVLLLGQRRYRGAATRRSSAARCRTCARAPWGRLPAMSRRATRPSRRTGPGEPS